MGRRYTSQGRTARDFYHGIETSCDGKGNNSTGGGVKTVSVLPETGKKNLLYKTPDGTIWHWVETTTVIHHDAVHLEVGKTYTFKDTITESMIAEIYNASGQDDGDIWWYSSPALTLIYNHAEGETIYTTVAYMITNENFSRYCISGGDILNCWIDNSGNRITPPTVTITQSMIDNFNVEGSHLEDWEILFVECHEAYDEEIEVKEYRQVLDVKAKEATAIEATFDSEGNPTITSDYAYFDEDGNIVIEGETAYFDEEGNIIIDDEEGEGYIRQEVMSEPTKKITGGVMTYDGSNFTMTNGLPYITTAPTSANQNGLIIVVLSSEPAQKYDGYLYIIKGE